MEYRLKSRGKSRETSNEASVVACDTGETRAKMGTMRIETWGWSLEKSSRLN